MGASTQPDRAEGCAALVETMPAGPVLAEADLALIWAALVAFRERVPAEDAPTQAQLTHLLTELAEEQARRHSRQHASVPPERLPSGAPLPWGF